MNTLLEEYKKGIVKLRRFNALDVDDEAAEDAILDELDKLWYAMNQDQRDVAGIETADSAT